MGVDHYWSDGEVTLYHGEAEPILAELRDAGVRADVAIVDPPYNDTHHAWDSWPIGWPGWVAEITDSMWCFGSARMFDTDRYRDDLRGVWQMSHDVIWEKNAGTANLRGDRFTRVHEHVRHYYRKKTKWRDVRHVALREKGTKKPQTFVRSAVPAGVHGARGATLVTLDGKRYMTSVRHHNKVWRSGIHASQKPVSLLEELVTFGAPAGGLVLDPMSGSGSTGKACQIRGRRAILIEADEAMCEKSARWLAETPMVLDVEEEEPATPRTVPVDTGEVLF